MTSIELHIIRKDGVAPQSINIREDATVEELLKLIDSHGHAELILVVEDEEQPRDRQQTLHHHRIGHGHHVHVHERLIRYEVDKEPQETERHILTPVEIMAKAGVDAKNHYLLRLLPHGGEESYKDDPNKRIHMHCGMRFVTASVGPVPVS